MEEVPGDEGAQRQHRRCTSGVSLRTFSTCRGWFFRQSRFLRDSAANCLRVIMPRHFNGFVCWLFGLLESPWAGHFRHTTPFIQSQIRTSGELESFPPHLMMEAVMELHTCVLSLSSKSMSDSATSLFTLKPFSHQFQIGFKPSSRTLD